MIACGWIAIKHVFSSINSFQNRLTSLLCWPLQVTKEFLLRCGLGRAKVLHSETMICSLSAQPAPPLWNAHS